MSKEAFKYYKRKFPPPSLDRLIDFSNKDASDNNARISGYSVLQSCSSREPSSTGLKPVSQWKAFVLEDKPGFIFISNPFTPNGQRFWIYQCLKYYTKKPNRLNLDAHGDVQGEDWWEKCQKYKNQEEGSQLMKKLRWATLGYHHNWDTKEYEESAHDPFPEDLAALSQQVAQAVGFTQFSAQAAIINFYHMDSTLSCHTDHSELNLTAPLLSFSFGQSAVFLLGGKSREEKPIAMKIESGDIVVMSGESRLCYHGVPLIFSAKSATWNIIDSETLSKYSQSPSFSVNPSILPSFFHDLQSDELWEPFEKYISTSRINMNVRQVLPQGRSSL